MSTFSQWHSWHLVEPSPWPLAASLGGGVMTLGMISLIYAQTVLPLTCGGLLMALIVYQWWRDVTREATFQGLHSMAVQWNMRWGVILFIVSEVMFFFSFFWAYFNSSLITTAAQGWPPMGVEAFNPFGIPLLNTALLLTSGVTVTWSHHAIVANSLKESKIALAITIALGVLFTGVQGYEYANAPFTFADSAYGSCFFMATGFHGLHVLIGSAFLGATLTRLMKGHLSPAHHFGFEAAAWYWHFVDVVWIFLFVWVYWWGYH